MGPYCKFCGQRCFCHLPEGTPPEALAALGVVTILATCPAGQAHSLEVSGWSIDTIENAIRNGDSPASVAVQGNYHCFQVGTGVRNHEEQR